MTKIEDALKECVEYLDIDRIFKIVGVFGKFQLLQIIPLVLAILTDIHILSYYFLGFIPEHQCNLPNSSRISEEYGANMTNAIVSAKVCSIEVHDENNRSADANVVLPCLYGYNYSTAQNRSIVTQFDLVCEKMALSELPETAVMTGLLVGSMFSFIGDVLGRRRLLMVSQFGVMVTVVPVTFFDDMLLICVGRFLTGFFTQLVQISSIVPLIEIVPTDTRPTLCLLLDICRSGAYLSLSLAAYSLRNYSWRILNIVTATSSLPTLVLAFFFMEESLRWLLVRKKHSEMVQIILKICRMNKVAAEEVLLADKRYYNINEVKNVTETESSHLLCRRYLRASTSNRHSNKPPERPTVNQTNATSHTSETSCKVRDEDVKSEKTYLNDLLTILQEPKLLIQLCIAWIIWFVDFFTLYSLFLLPHTLSADKYVNFALNASASICGAPIIWTIMTRTSRKRCGVFVHGLTSVGILVSVVLRTLNNGSTVLSAVTLCAGLIARLSVAFCMSFMKIYTPEIIPTNVRNMGVGVAYFAGRIGGIAASFVVLLSTVRQWLPMLVIIVCNVLVTGGILFLPETRNRELPQNVTELKAMNDKE